MSQELGKGSAGWFWLTVSQAVVVRLSRARAAGSWSPWGLAWTLSLYATSELLHGVSPHELVWASSQHGGSRTVRMLTRQLKARRGRVLASQADAASPFMTEPGKSCSIIPTYSLVCTCHRSPTSFQAHHLMEGMWKKVADIFQNFHTVSALASLS